MSSKTKSFRFFLKGGGSFVFQCDELEVIKTMDSYQSVSWADSEKLLTFDVREIVAILEE